jgi:hypothetical protein
MLEKVDDRTVQDVIKAMFDGMNPSRAEACRATGEKWLIELELGTLSMSEESRRTLTAALDS